MPNSILSDVYAYLAGVKGQVIQRSVGNPLEFQLPPFESRNVCKQSVLLEIYGMRNFRLLAELLKRCNLEWKVLRMCDI